MSEANQLYELTRLIDDRETMQREFSEIMLALREMLQKRYVNKLHNVVESQQRQATEHPSREITLLRALREFTVEDQKDGFDRMIDMAMMMNTATKMRQDLSHIAEQSKPTYGIGAPGEVHAMENETASLQGAAGVTNILLTLALMKVI